MPMYKYTMLIDFVSTPESRITAPVRTAGWSESVYAATLAAATRNSFNRLCQARAGLLSDNCRVVGQRYQQVDPVGASSTASSQFQGNSGAGDYPSLALLCRAGSAGFGNVRPLYLRGVPDIWVVGGEWNPAGAAAHELSTYFDELAGWQFRGRDLTQPRVKVNFISTAGVVTTQDDITVAAGNQVQLLNLLGSDGENYSGRYQVVSFTDARHFTIQLWPVTVEGVSGSVRKIAVVYPTISRALIFPSRIVTKKVGRPFFQFRGRASKKS